VLEEVQSYYQGKEDFKDLGNCVNAWFTFHYMDFGLDIYRIKFRDSNAQKIAVENFTQLFHERDGSYCTDHWIVFTEEIVQTTNLSSHINIHV
jgi:hypothetical protein